MKLLKLLLLTLLTLIPQQVYADDDASALEYKVKAVVLFNFAKYVHWPEKTFADDKQAIKVCILGKNPFGDVFSSPEAPKEAQNRPLQVIELPTTVQAKDVVNCQILYWTSKVSKEASALSSTLKEHGVFTVSDEKDENSLVSFTIEDEKVRFIIHHKTAKSIGFEISSQLLKLAILDE